MGIFKYILIGLLVFNVGYLQAANRNKTRVQKINAPVKKQNNRLAAIETSDGTLFNGEIVEKNNDWVIFKTENGEKLTLPISEVISINGTHPSKVRSRSPARVSGEVYWGNAFLDVTCYGYEVTVEINNEKAYSGKDKTYSGLTKVKVGNNDLRVTYQPAENPHLNDLSVNVRLAENNNEIKLLNWKATARSGEEKLTFSVAGQPAGSASPNLTPTQKSSKGASSADDLIAKYKQAHKTKNADLFVDLMYLKGVTEATLKQTRSIAKDMLFTMDFESIAVGPKREGMGGSYTSNGVTYVPNLEITGSLDIKYKDGSSHLPIGMKDGSYYLSTAVPK